MSNPARHSDNRTHFEAVMDVRYGVCFNDLCERFYSRLDMAFGALSLTGGSAAAASVVNGSPTLAAAAGLVLAVVAVFERLVGAAKKAEQHAAARRAYGDINALAQAMGVEEIDARLRVLQSSTPSGISSLGMPAYNANLRSAGHAQRVQPLSRIERLAALMA
jgi:hypothetical protein